MVQDLINIFRETGTLDNNIMSEINYYWGKPDISISFCEEKYGKYFWVAEYYNTISSLFYVMVGVMLLRTRFNFLGKLLCCVGIGAMLLHATLRHWSQMGDEMSMLALSFYSLKELRPRTNQYLIYPILISYLVLNRYFLCFFLTFTGMQLLIAKYARKRINNKNKKWINLYLISFIFGFICWLLDQFCKTKMGNSLEPFQFHAWWHFFTASSIGFGFIALLN